MQKTDDALDKLQRAAALEPNAHVYATMGMIYGRKGQIDAAAGVLTEVAARSIRIQMRRTPTWATSICMRNDPTQAVEEFRRSLQINPNNPMARQALLNLRASTPR